MVQAWKVLSLAGLLAGGCVGPVLNEPLVRAQLGVNSRQVANPAPSNRVVGSVARSTSTSTMPTRPQEADAPLDSAITGALQFSVRYFRHLYVGGEVEAGAFARDSSSNYGGMVGVMGLETGGALAWLSLELAAGKHWMRYDLESQDVGITIVEPRVRAQVLINPQISLGGMVGASVMPEDRGWTAGFYLGIYSHPVDGI